ncbi:hypothetical protein N9948_01390 [bacterium]|nr:hypothetical protein [bacterium]
MTRYYNDKGYIAPYTPGQRDPSDRMLNERSMDKFLRLAQIVRVDYEAMEVDLQYLDSNGVEPKVPVTQAYQGPRSFLGGMPEILDWVIVGYFKSGTLSTPAILGFFPRSYQTGLKNDKIGISKALEKVFKPIRFKMRKLYSGEIYSASCFGSEIHLDKNVSISNSSLNEILLRSADQSVNISAINHYLNTAGVRVQTGLIHRNALIGDPEFTTTNKGFPTYINSEGVAYYTPNLTSTISKAWPYGKETVNDNNPAFVEHRTEIKEYEDPITPVTGANSGVDVDSFYKLRADGSSDKPLVVQVLGTLIGNDHVGNRDRYGMILKPSIFPDLDTFKGQLEESGCVIDGGINQATTLAAAYTLKVPNSGTAIYINKQGKYFANIASSTSADPIGSGESAEINLKGHTKMYMGKNRSKQRSLTLNTGGGVSTNWGFDNEKARSWDATFRKGVSWNILGNDKDGISWNMTVSGDVRHTIEGSRFTEIKGDDIRYVHGTAEDQILGRKVNQYVNDFANNYGGNYNETSVGHYNQTLAQGFSRTIAAPDVLSGSINAESHKIILGNYSHTMLLGQKSETIVLGTKDTKIGVGSETTTIGVGSYTVRVGVGTIDIQNAAGAISIKTLAGIVEITGGLSVNIKSALNISLDSPFINVGGLPLQGGIVNNGPAGHRDYITGALLLGSFTATVNSI